MTCLCDRDLLAVIAFFGDVRVHMFVTHVMTRKRVPLCAVDGRGSPNTHCSRTANSVKEVKLGSRPRRALHLAHPGRLCGPCARRTRGVPGRCRLAKTKTKQAKACAKNAIANATKTDEQRFCPTPSPFQLCDLQTPKTFHSEPLSCSISSTAAPMCGHRWRVARAAQASKPMSMRSCTSAGILIHPPPSPSRMVGALAPSG